MSQMVGVCISNQSLNKSLILSDKPDILSHNRRKQSSLPPSDMADIISWSLETKLDLYFCPRRRITTLFSQTELLFGFTQSHLGSLINVCVNNKCLPWQLKQILTECLVGVSSTARLRLFCNYWTVSGTSVASYTCINNLVCVRYSGRNSAVWQ